MKYGEPRKSLYDSNISEILNTIGIKTCLCKESFVWLCLQAIKFQDISGSQYKSEPYDLSLAKTLLEGDISYHDMSLFKAQCVSNAIECACRSINHRARGMFYRQYGRIYI